MASKPQKRPMGHRPTLEKLPETSMEATPFLTNELPFNADTYFESLNDMTKEQLADRYVDVNSQSQMIKGLILLKARELLPSNKEFGEWVDSVHTLCADAPAVRNRYMHLARFFKSRAMTGISLTAAYQISKPDNDSVAVEVYEEVLNKNLPVADVTQLIKHKKAIVGASSDNQDNLPKPVPEKKRHDVRPIVLPENIKIVIDVVNGLDLQAADAIALLEDCIESIKATQ
jgi:hypothetical protein